MRRSLILAYVALTTLYITSFPHNTVLSVVGFTGSILAFIALALRGLRVPPPLVALLTVATVLTAPINPYLIAPLTPLLIHPLLSLTPKYSKHSLSLIGVPSIVMSIILAGSPYALMGAGSSFLVIASREFLSRRKYLVPIIITYSSLGTLVLTRLGYIYASSIFTGILVPTALLGVKASLPQLRAGASIARRPPKEFKPFIVADLIIASLFELNYIVGLAIMVQHRDPLGIAGALIASYGLVGFAYHIYKVLTPRPELVMKPLKSRWYTAFLISRDVTYSILNRYAGRLRPLIERAAVLENPVIYAAKWLVGTVVALILTPLIALILYMFVGPPALTALLVPAIMPLAPIAMLSSRVGDRRRGVEDELPWLSIYATVMQSAGIPLHESLRRLVGRGLLRFIEREARVVEKHVMVLGKDAITALEDVARNHPSRVFRDFIMGYTSILRTGGDLVAYLESRTKELLEWLSFRFRRYADSAVGIGEVLTALFTIFVSIFAIAGSAVPTISSGFVILGIPLIAVAMYSVISNSQPKARLTFRVSHFIPAVASFTTALLLWRFGYVEWLAGALVALVLGASYGTQYWVQLRVVRAHESALEDFLRDLTELRKVGLPPSRAILSLSRERSYNGYFDSIVKSIATQLRLNVPLGDAVVRVWMPSWLTRVVLFIVSEIESSGGGTVKVLEELTNFVSTYVMARREMVSKLRIYEFLVALTPIILSFFITITEALSTVFTPEIARLAGMASRAGIAGKLFIPITTPEGLRVVKLVALEASASFALLASKAVDFTLKNTLRLVVIASTFLVYNVLLEPLVKALITSWFTLPTAP